MSEDEDISPEYLTKGLRDLEIYCEYGENLVEVLTQTNINGWSFGLSGLPEGCLEYAFKRRDEIITLRFGTKNKSKAKTVNVIPYDPGFVDQSKKYDPSLSNRTLRELSDALTEAGIDNHIIVSEDDLKRDA